MRLWENALATCALHMPNSSIRLDSFCLITPRTSKRCTKKPCGIWTLPASMLSHFGGFADCTATRVNSEKLCASLRRLLRCQHSRGIFGLACWCAFLLARALPKPVSLRQHPMNWHWQKQWRVRWAMILRSQRVGCGRLIWHICKAIKTLQDCF